MRELAAGMVWEPNVFKFEVGWFLESNGVSVGSLVKRKSLLLLMVELAAECEGQDCRTRSL